MKRNLTFIILFTVSLASYGQLNGTKSIPGDYASIAAAISALNNYGVGSGGVTFNVAAGHTETFSSLSAGLITATGTAANPIVFQKAGAGLNPVITAATPGVSTTLDGIITIAGGDYISFIGINVEDNPDNTTATSQMEWGYALLKANSAAPVDGCQYITIKNCTITLNRSNTNTNGIKVYNHTPSSTSTLTLTVTSDANNNITIDSCSIQNTFTPIVFNGYAASTPYDLYDQNITIKKCKLQNYAGASTAYGIRVIYANNVNILNNVINNAANGGAASTSTTYGIMVSTGTNSNLVCRGNSVSLNRGNVSSSIYGIYNSFTGNVVMSSNTLTNFVVEPTGSVYFMYNSSTCSSIAIDSNQINNSTSLNTTGSIYVIYNSSGTPNVFVRNNTVENLTRTAASGTMYCYYNGASPSGGKQTVSNNIFRNLNQNASGSSSGFYGTYMFTSNTQDIQVNNNQIYNNNHGSGTVYNMYNTYGDSVNIYNNSIHDITSSGTMYGLYPSGSSCINVDARNNEIYNLSSSGTSSSVYAVYLTGSSSTTNVKFHNNRVRNITESGTTGVVYGIYHVTIFKSSIYNNFISEIYTPASSSANAANGIYISSGGTVNLFYNTVYLNASSSSSSFGSNAVYTSSTPTVDMRNNIFVNASTPGISGYAVAYRRSSTTLTTYSANSDYNCFFAGIPGTTRVIFTDGTNYDQTLSAYKARVAPRDMAAFSENPPFISTTAPTNLHINPAIPTQCESNGIRVTDPVAVADDFDANIRQGETGYIGTGTAPDVGADEFEGTPLDLTPPAISYTLLGNDIVAGSRTLASFAEINDPSGVNITAGTAPRIYYKKKSNNNTYADNTSATNGWKYSETSNTTSPFSFTINYALLFGGSVSVGDTIQYFVVAQDLTLPPNVGINTGTFATAPSSVNLTAAAFPIGGTINAYSILGTLSGTKTVGSGGDYLTLTGEGGLFQEINNKVLAGNLVAKIITNTTEPGTYALNQLSETGAGGYSLKIQAADTSTVEKLITGSVANGMIRFDGADRIIIDGRVNGSGKYLRFRNTNTSNPTVIFINGACYDTLQYCYFEGASTTSGGIIRFSTTTANQGNSNNVIRNNVIRDRSDATGVPLYLIYSLGTAAYPNQENSITNNEMFNFSSYGIYLSGTGNGDAWKINNNKIYQTESRTSTLYVMYILAGSGHEIAGNSIGGSSVNRSGPAMSTSSSFYGMYLSVGTVSPTSIQGNTISNIAGGSSVRGIYATSGNVNIGTITGNTFGGLANSYDTIQNGYDNGIIYTTSSGIINIENNLIGNISYYDGSGDRTAGMYCTSGTLTIRNNIIRDIKHNGTSTGYSYLPVGMYISTSTSGNLIERNTIYNIENTNTGTSAYTSVGIIIAGSMTNSTVSGNYIYNIKANGTGTGTSANVVHAIYSTAGSVTYCVNMIALGNGLPPAAQAVGIYDGGSGTNNFYNNSINIFGTASENNTSCYYRTSTSVIDFRNNIVVNTRSGGTSKGYAMANASSTLGTGISNYNSLFTSDLSALCNFNSVDQTLAGWQVSTGGDANSFIHQPGFVSNINLHTTSTGNCVLNGTGTSTGCGCCLSDIDNVAFSSPPDIGCDEFIPVLPATPVSGGNKTICEGSSTTLSVSGTSGIVKWYDSPSMNNLVGTGNTLTTGSLLSPGTYAFYVTDSLLTCVSLPQIITLTIDAQALGGSVSGSKSVCIGEGTGVLTLSGHSGTILRWQKRIDGGSWTNISNTLTTYSETPGVSGTWDYRAVLKNGVCDEVFSIPAVIVVNALPEVTWSTPIPAQCVSESAYPLSGGNPVNGTYSGNTVLNGVFSPSTAGVGTYLLTYTYTDVNGCTAQATNTITVNPLPQVFNLSGVSHYCAASTGTTLNLSGSQTGVQYQLFKNSTAYGDPLDGTGSPLSWNNITEGTYTVNATITATGCENNMTGSVTVQADPVLSANITPDPANVLVSHNLSLNGNHSGGTGTFTSHSWTGPGAAYLNSTSIPNPVFNCPDVTEIAVIYTVTDSHGCTAIDDLVINVLAPVGIPVMGNEERCNTGTMTMNAQIGMNGSEVQFSLDGSTVIYSDNTAPYQYTTPTVPAGTSITVWARTYSSVLGEPSMWVTATATAHLLSNGGIVTGNIAAICLGETTGTMTVVSQTGLPTGWEKRHNGGAWQPVANTSISYVDLPGAIGMWEYRARIKNGTCPEVYSLPYGISVSPPAIGGMVAGNMALCYGGPTGPMVAQGFVGNVVGWQKRVDNNPWIYMSVTSTTYNEVPVTSGLWQYRAVIKSGPCDTITSAPLNVMVWAHSQGGYVAGGSPVCIGNSTPVLNLQNYLGNIVAWQKKLDNGTWTTINHTGSSYSEIPASPGAWQYRAVVVNGLCNAAFSQSAVVIVNDHPVPGILGPDGSFCPGSYTPLMTLTGYSGTIEMWQKRFNGGNWVNIYTSQPSYQEIPEYEGSWEYRVVVRNGECPGQYSTVCTMNVIPGPVAYVVTGNPFLCPGTSGATVLLTGSETTAVYQLLRDSENYGDPVAGTGQMLSWTDLPEGKYTVMAQSMVTGCSREMEGSLNIVPAGPIHTYIVSGGGTYCADSPGAEVILEASEPITVYQLLRDGEPYGPEFQGTGDPMIWIDLPYGVYTILGINPETSCTQLMEGSAMITVLPLPQVMMVSGGGIVCANVGAGIILNNSELIVEYQLYMNGEPTGDYLMGTGGALLFPNVMASGIYTVEGVNTLTSCANWMNGDILVTLLPVPEVNAGTDQSIYFGTSTTLEGSATGGTPAYSYLWSPASSLSNPAIPNPVATPLVTTIYQLAVTDSHGCTATDQVEIAVITPPGTSPLNGLVTYANTQHTPMTNTTVKLYSMAGNLIASAATDAGGHYSFNEIPNGTYVITAETQQVPGGFNSTDAMIVMKHFVSLINLQGIFFKAGDVNLTYFLNALDAFMIQQRFVGIMNTFPVGDWAFEQDTIVLTGFLLTHDLRSLCYGDVNASNTPGTKTGPGINLIEEGEIMFIPGEEINLPLSIRQNITPGAVSLKLRFNPAEVMIKNVSVPHASGNLVYYVNGDLLSISYVSDRPHSLTDGQVLLNVALLASKGGKVFEVANGCELADFDAEVIADAEIGIPKLLASAPEALQLSCNPNPAKHFSELAYTIPASGNVSIVMFNMLGETVRVIEIAEKPSGTHSVELKLDGIPAGIYNIRCIFTGPGKPQMKTTNLNVVE